MVTKICMGDYMCRIPTATQNSITIQLDNLVHICEVAHQVLTQLLSIVRRTYASAVL